MSDRLTAIYRFEHKINASNANQNDGGHLSYVGLSGGLWTTTLGKRVDTSTFAGARGSIGDTGVADVFQIKSKKSKGNEN